MKKIFLLSTLIYSVCYLAAEDDFKFTCKDFTGSSIEIVNGITNLSEDAYSGTIISFSLMDNNNGLIEYTGRIKRKDSVRLLAGSNDGFISFFRTFKDVHKIYTFYLNQPLVLSITEIQTQLITGSPQIRTFMGTCT